MFGMHTSSFLDVTYFVSSHIIIYDSTARKQVKKLRLSLKQESSFVKDTLYIDSLSDLTEWSPCCLTVGVVVPTPTSSSSSISIYDSVKPTQILTKNFL